MNVIPETSNMGYEHARLQESKFKLQGEINYLAARLLKEGGFVEGRARGF